MHTFLAEGCCQEGVVDVDEAVVALGRSAAADEDADCEGEGGCWFEMLSDT